MMPYERYEAWKVAHELVLEIYRITDQWPACERYQLTAQIRRAALSVPTNIAEGAAKRGPRVGFLTTNRSRWCMNSEIELGASRGAFTLPSRPPSRPKPTVRPSIRPPVHPSIRPSVRPVHPSISPSVRPFTTASSPAALRLHPTPSGAPMAEDRRGGGPAR